MSPFSRIIRSICHFVAAGAFLGTAGAGVSSGQMVVGTPAPIGDQLFFFYDSRTDRVPFLCVTNLASEAVEVETVFYSQDLGRRLSSRRDVLAAFGNVIMDPSQDPKVQGAAGLAVVTPVDKSGVAIVPPSASYYGDEPPLVGSFTLANTRLGAGFGQSPFARLAVNQDGERASVGAPVDGTVIRYQRFAPDALIAPTYFDPATLSPEAEDGNRVVLAVFEDDYASGFGIKPAKYDFAASFFDTKGNSVGRLKAVPVSGLGFETFGGLAGSTKLQGSGKIMFILPSGAPQGVSVFGLVSQAVGTYAIGQRMAGIFLGDRDTEKLVFVVSGIGNADLGGLSGADAICERHAATIGHGGRFMAWLSDTKESPATRFRKSSLPYVRADGIVIADDWGDLVDGKIDHPIDKDVTGRQVTEHSVYTATTSDGRGFATDTVFTCGEWTSGDIAAAVGVGITSMVDSEWTLTRRYGSGCDGRLSGPVALYCFEQ